MPIHKDNCRTKQNKYKFQEHIHMVFHWSVKCQGRNVLPLFLYSYSIPSSSFSHFWRWHALSRSWQTWLQKQLCIRQWGSTSEPIRRAGTHTQTRHIWKRRSRLKTGTRTIMSGLKQYLIGQVFAYFPLKGSFETASWSILKIRSCQIYFFFFKCWALVKCLGPWKLSHSWEHFILMRNKM